MTKSCSNTLQWQPNCIRGRSCVHTPNCQYLLAHLVARRCKRPAPHPLKLSWKFSQWKTCFTHNREWNLARIYLFWYDIEASLNRKRSQKFIGHSEFGGDIRWSVRNTKPVVFVVWFWPNFAAAGDRHKLLLTVCGFRENGRPHVPCGCQCKTHLWVLMFCWPCSISVYLS